MKYLALFVIVTAILTGCAPSSAKYIVGKTNTTTVTKAN